LWGQIEPREKSLLEERRERDSPAKRLIIVRPAGGVGDVHRVDLGFERPGLAEQGFRRRRQRRTGLGGDDEAAFAKATMARAARPEKARKDFAS